MSGDRENDISILLYNISLEHSAIVQYLYHIFLIQDAEVTGEIEEIARQEMRHLKWFAEKVVELGGKLKIDRADDKIKLGIPSVREMIKSDVDAEELAIQTYMSQIERVRCDDVKKLLERVVEDEMSHKVQFSEILLHIPEDAKVEVRRFEGKEEGDEGVLLKLFEEEYKSVIEYIHAFFLAKNPEHKNILLDIAIESMVHMGWIGEELGKMKVLPEMKRYVARIEGRNAFLSIGLKIKFEKDALETYRRSVEKIRSDELRKLAERIVKQEEYHEYRLRRFLGDMLRRTVGSLKGKK